MVRPLTCALAIALALVVVDTGCRDTNPVVPHFTATRLDRMWPNADGSYWQYDVVARSWNWNLITYATPAEVPAAPSCVQVTPLLDPPASPVGTTVDDLWYELRFKGLLTTQSGVTRQNLFETLIRTSNGAVVPTGSSFLRLLDRARPDLRPRLRAMTGMTALAETSHIYPSALLHGYAWEKTAHWIGTYGDLDTLLAWKYLDANLTTGHEFTHQLVPELATDVLLHGRILGVRNVTTPAGTFTNAIRCVYVIDFGILQETDPSGNPVGYSREYEFGYVDYVPDVGPVASYDRQLVSVGDSTALGFGDVTEVLRATGPVPLAMR